MLNWSDLCSLLSCLSGAVTAALAAHAQKAGWIAVIIFAIGGLLLAGASAFGASKLAYWALARSSLPYGRLKDAQHDRMGVSILRHSSPVCLRSLSCYRPPDHRSAFTFPMNFSHTPLRRLCLVRACGYLVLALALGALPFIVSADQEGRNFSHGAAGVCLVLSLFNFWKARQTPPNEVVTMNPEELPFRSRFATSGGCYGYRSSHSLRWPMSCL